MTHNQVVAGSSQATFITEMSINPNNMKTILFVIVCSSFLLSSSQLTGLSDSKWRIIEISPNFDIGPQIHEGDTIAFSSKYIEINTHRNRAISNLDKAIYYSEEKYGEIKVLSYDTDIIYSYLYSIKNDSILTLYRINFIYSNALSDTCKVDNGPFSSPIIDSVFIKAVKL